MAGTAAGRSLRVGDARELAASLLAAQPGRWRHTVGVAHRAEELVFTIGTDDPVILVSAAWLHDIGYAPAVRDTGFHPLDGARYLDRHGWPPRLTALVTHHSGASLIAAVEGLAEQLAEYPHEHGAVPDALTYADQTVGPHGQSMKVETRMADMLERHGAGSPNALAHHQRGPCLQAAAKRVRARIARSDVHSGWEED